MTDHRDGLIQRLRQHRLWAEAIGRSGTRLAAVDPSGSNLASAELADVELTGADLTGTFLAGAALDGAVLDSTTLDGTSPTPGRPWSG